MKFFNYLKKSALMSTLFVSALITTGCGKTKVEDGQISGKYGEFEQETFDKELAELKFDNIAGNKEQTEIGLKVGTGINVGVKYKEKEAKLNLEGEAKARMYDENEKMHLQAAVEAKTNIFMDKDFLTEVGLPIAFENNVDIKSEEKVYLVDDTLYTNIATEGLDTLTTLLTLIDEEGIIKDVMNGKKKITIDEINDGLLEDLTVKEILEEIYEEIDDEEIDEMKNTLTLEDVNKELTKYGLTLGFDTKKGLKLKLATSDEKGEALIAAILGKTGTSNDTFTLETLGLEFYVALDEEYMFQAAALKVNVKGAVAIDEEKLEFNGSAFLNIEYGKQEIKLPSFDDYTELDLHNTITVA